MSVDCCEPHWEMQQKEPIVKSRDLVHFSVASLSHAENLINVYISFKVHLRDVVFNEFLMHHTEVLCRTALHGRFVPASGHCSNPSIYSCVCQLQIGDRINVSHVGQWHPASCIFIQQSHVQLLDFFLTYLPVPLWPNPNGKACLKSAVQT